MTSDSETLLEKETGKKFNAKGIKVRKLELNIVLLIIPSIVKD